MFYDIDGNQDYLPVPVVVSSIVQGTSTTVVLLEYVIPSFPPHVEKSRSTVVQSSIGFTIYTLKCERVLSSTEYEY